MTMKREIKFRAKTLSTNEWVFGDLHLLTKFPHIHDGEVSKSSIQPDTVGQFTGRHDKNGKQIYEGDILKHINGNHTCQVLFSERSTSYILVFVTPDKPAYDMGIYDVERCFEVIGNIYDNKELLEE